nr:MAG TPA: hypothetical protein [Caudoviricetes sp.]
MTELYIIIALLAILLLLFVIWFRYDAHHKDEMQRSIDSIAIDLMLMGKRDWNRYINSMINHKLQLLKEEKYEEIDNINRIIDKEIRDFKEYYDD